MKTVLGQKLRAARERARLTQTELASRVGINQADVSSYESGRYEPLSSKLYELARALEADHLPLSYWFTETAETQPPGNQ